MINNKYKLILKKGVDSMQCAHHTIHYTQMLFKRTKLSLGPLLKPNKNYPRINPSIYNGYRSERDNEINWL